MSALERSLGCFFYHTFSSKYTILQFVITKVLKKISTLIGHSSHSTLIAAAPSITYRLMRSESIFFFFASSINYILNFIDLTSSIIWRNFTILANKFYFIVMPNLCVHLPYSCHFVLIFDPDKYIGDVFQLVSPKDIIKMQKTLF